MKINLQLFGSGDGLLTKIRQALSDGDAETAESLVEEHEDDYEGDLWEKAFRIAVQEGCYEYVENHCEDVDLNDDSDGTSTYIHETTDQDIIDLLIESGACRCTDDYEDYRFAIETVNGTIIAFDGDFQIEAFDRLLEKLDLTREEIMNIFDNDEADEYEIPEALKCIDASTLSEICDVLRVSVYSDEIEFEDAVGDDQGWILRELLENLGWKCGFEGDMWKFESNGVYFIEPEEEKEMSEEWTFTYFGWFGRGDSSDELEWSTSVSEEEYKFLSTVQKYSDDELEYDEEDEDTEEGAEEFDLDDFVSENASLIAHLQRRVQKEIESAEAENFEDEESMPEIVVNWPWE